MGFFNTRSTSTVQPLRARALRLLSLLILGLSANGLAADPREDEIRELRREIEALKERLERLERGSEASAERADGREHLRQSHAAQAGPVQPDEAMSTADLDARSSLAALSAVSEPTPETLRFGGALRFNASLRNFDEGSRDRKGESGFELFRIGVSGGLQDYLISAEYRFYPYMNALHHGWIGYDFGRHGSVHLGVSQVPFGLLPYAAHSFWFGVPYYLGLADNYDLGIQYLVSTESWKVHLAFYKNSELGDSASLERYAFDVVRVGEQQNEKINQLNTRVARTFETGSGSTHEVGLSGQLGELYNRVTGRTGHHWALAAHWNAHVSLWNFQAQLARFEYHPKNPMGVSDRVVALGALATSYEAASRGSVAVANIAYSVPHTGMYFDELILYNNYSILFKDVTGFADSQINTIGAAMGIGPLYMYLDWIHARNMPFFGDGSLAGDGVRTWKSRINLNMGYYW